MKYLSNIIIGDKEIYKGYEKKGSLICALGLGQKWQLYNGIRKSDKKKISILIFNISDFKGSPTEKKHIH